ncbi:hypothetical protein Acor_47710 [Acrocarpospora corrugata]|uniref:Uncharacterized protein n=1 Tax=Acrocarpospora corrugata TaxID=35763 RepID=A0A5M3W0Z4_9ACTN|nr:hypothetical protein [Acrocarpospora corrugata]GES02705.1 hypothetical protein Acor_47710 [Acrocarpospora corrugata]
MAKLTAMTNINNALQNSALHTAKVWNAFHSIAEGPTAAFKADPGTDPKVPELIPDSKTFMALSRNEKITFASSAKHNGLLDKDLEWTDLTAPIFGQLRNRLKTDYLKRGDESIANFPSGLCTMFACAVLGFLARNHHLLDNGSVVELFNYQGEQGGHAFVVVNRAGTENDVDSWGAACYTIDPWYARHRLNAPGSNAVKDMTAGTNYSDLAFNQFLKDANSRKVHVTFTHLDLINTFI